MDSSPQHSPTARSVFNTLLSDLPPPETLTRVGRGMPQRAELETYVRSAFAHRYQAQIHELPGCLMALRRANGELTAVAGLRFADEAPLFLEQYLDAPVDQYLGMAGSIDRRTVVEIGSLAAPTPGQVRYMMIALTAYLHSAGYQWVVCTAISSLRNTLARMGLTPILLGSADPARLGEAATDWGRYYEERPQVIAGHLTEAAVLLEARCANNRNPVDALWRNACEQGRLDRIAKIPPGLAPAAFATGICA